MKVKILPAPANFIPRLLESGTILIVNGKSAAYMSASQTRPGFHLVLIDNTPFWVDIRDMILPN